MWNEGLTADEIQAIRGDRSRAEFARLLGVTPLTVYRWEQPAGTRQARRPRAAMQQRLVALRDADLEARRHSSRGSFALDEGESQLPPEEERALIPVLRYTERARWLEAEDSVLTLLSSGALASPAGRALATVAATVVKLLGRNDVRGAYSTLEPVLERLHNHRLPPAVELRVRALAALMHASPHGALFDLGRVKHHAARARHLLAQTPNGEVRAVVRGAELLAAYHYGDPSVAPARGLSSQSLLAAAHEPVPRVLAALAVAYESLAAGNTAEAARRFRGVAADAEGLGFAAIECRALAHLCRLLLATGKPPDSILALAARSRQAARRARLEPGFADIQLAGAEAEALVRLGRLDEARSVLDDARRVADAVRWPPSELVVVELRLCTLRREAEPLRALRQRLTEHGGVQFGPDVTAAEMFAAGGLAALDNDGEAAATAFERAASELEAGGGRPWLERAARARAFASRALLADAEAARAAFLMAQRVLDRHPSVWDNAWLLQHEALLRALEGHHDEARQVLEAALSAFGAAGDRPGCAATRRYDAIIAGLAGETDATELLERSDRELQTAGFAPPALLSHEGIQRLVSAALMRSQPPSPTATEESDGDARLPASALVVPVERLSLRGVSVPRLLEGLATVSAELCGDAEVTIDELLADGDSRQVAVHRGHRGGVPTSREFSGGPGRRYRLTVHGPHDAGHRDALELLSAVAGLAVEAALLRSRADAASIAPASNDEALGGFVAASEPLRNLRREIARLRGSRSTVLIAGESGTGKEVVARAVYELSTRSDRPFVTFNCSAVPRELFEGQLFGYRRGSFTGATADHPGVIRAAHQGTLFLDEIGDLPLDLQPKLLRFLENAEVIPLGETRPTRVDVRVIAATHRDLADMVREGRFRRDLFYRLQVVPLELPPLRDRPEDILPLARHFLRQLTPDASPPPLLAPDAEVALTEHTWPGNVRELRNVIERSLALSPGARVLSAGRIRLS